MRPPNVRACVEVSHRLTLEGHYGGVLIFLSSSVRAFVELLVCLAFPFMTSSVRLSFAAEHFSCGRISCSQSDQSGKFMLDCLLRGMSRLFRFSIVLVRKDTTVVSNIRPGVRIFSNVKAFGARC